MTTTAIAQAIEIANSIIIPCDDRCMFAKLDECDCECGGKNHQQGHKLPAHQREIIRTKAGRRVKHLTPGTFDFRLAESMYAMRQEGLTKREIAKQANVSAPTVRRLITRFMITMAALGVELEDLDAA
jgi:hypothetical protein